MKWIKKKYNNPDYDYSNRDKHQRFYQTSNWQRLRLVKLNDSPLCECCLKENLIEPATVVDHIESLTDNYSLRLDYNNLQSLCSICHNKKSRGEQLKYIQQKKQVLIDERMNELNNF